MKYFFSIFPLPLGHWPISHSQHHTMVRTSSFPHIYVQKLIEPKEWTGLRLQKSTESLFWVTLILESLSKASPAECICPWFFTVILLMAILNSCLVPKACLLLLYYADKIASFLGSLKLSSGLYRALGEEMQESLVVQWWSHPVQPTCSDSQRTTADFPAQDQSLRCFVCLSCGDDEREERWTSSSWCMTILPQGP